MNEQKPFDPAKALKASLLDPLQENEKPPTVISICGKSCMTAGSFSTIIGKAKARKGFLVGGITVAAASGSCTIGGIKGNFNNGKTGVIYFDTEQGAYWGQVAHKRIVKAMGNEQPQNLQYYNLQQYSPAQRLQMIDTAIINHPKLLMVVIDGIRDLISSINDEGQATEMASQILRWCAIKQIHVICVLHMNKNDFNARGHIGSELINKSETVISVTKEKEDWISTVKQEYCRDMEFTPFSFVVDEDGLPRLTDHVEQPAVTKKKDEEIGRFGYVFKEHHCMNNALLLKRYMEASSLKESAANKHIATALVSGIIIKDERGNYSFPQTESNDETIPF